jgi:hypothetical protein
MIDILHYMLILSTYSTEIGSVLGGTGNQVGDRLGGLATGLGNNNSVLGLSRVLLLTSLL